MSIKNKILQDIIDLSSKDEKPYAGLAQELEQSSRSVSGDLASTAHRVIVDSISGAEADTLDGLKNRLQRLSKLKQTIQQADLGEESPIILESLRKAESAIQTHYDEKKKTLSKLSGVVSKLTSNIEQYALVASGNDPLVALASKAGSFLKDKLSKRLEAKREQQAVLKNDATSLYGSSLESNKPSAPEPVATMPSPAEPTFDAPLYQAPLNVPYEGLVQEKPTEYGGEQPKKNKSSPKSGKFKGSSVDADVAGNVEFIAEELLLVIDALGPLQSIAKNLETMVKDAALQRDVSEFADSGSGAPVTGAANIKMPGKEDAKKGGGLKKLLPNFDLKKLASSALGGLTTTVSLGMASLVAGLGWAIVDGISGFLKSSKWGVNSIAGAIGGFFGGTGDNQVLRTVGNMGKWALLGAGIGSIVPVIGTAIGGLVGALIGGLMGWIGGENIAGFFDEFGIWVGESFSNGLDMIKNFFLDMWGGMRDKIDKVFNVMDTAQLTMINWIKGIVDWIIDADPTGLAGKYLGGISENLGSQQSNIQGRMDKRLQEQEQRREDSNTRQQNLEDKRKKQAENKKDRQELRAALKKQRGVVDSAGGTNTKTSADMYSNMGNNIGLGQAIPATSMAPGAVGGVAPSLAPGASGGAPSNTTGGRGTPITPSGGSMSKDETKNAVLSELAAKGITDPDAQANVLANLQAESNFKAQSENLNYSAKTFMKLYGPGSGNKVRVKNLQEAQAIVDQGPEAIGNLIYGGRMGNAADEGYKFRGRGLVQLTGKDNYTAMSKKLGVDLLENPDLANDPQIAAKIAAQYYADRKSKFNYNDINQVAKATGHAGGAAENLRRAQYAQQLKAEMASGKISADGVLRPEQIKPKSTVVQASLNADMSAQSSPTAPYQTVNQKSAQAAVAPAVVNVSNNSVNNASSGGQQQQSGQQPVGVTSMTTTWQQGLRA